MIDRLLGHEHESQEVMCFLQSFGWGILLLAYPDALNASVVFNKMSSLFNDYLWGLILICYGSLGAYAYYVNNITLRRLGAMSGVIGWTLIGYFIFIDFRPVIGVIIVPLNAFISALSYIRLGYKGIKK